MKCVFNNAFSDQSKHREGLYLNKLYIKLNSIKIRKTSVVFNLFYALVYCTLICTDLRCLINLN